jgi:hypothetical protein
MRRTGRAEGNQTGDGRRLTVSTGRAGFSHGRADVLRPGNRPGPWEREEGAEIVLLAAIHLGGAWEGEESPNGWLGHGMTASE